MIDMTRPTAPSTMAFVGLARLAFERLETGAGGITTTGNAHLRRVRVESARHYRHHPFVRPTLRVRQRGAPAAVIAGPGRHSAASSSLSTACRARQVETAHRHARGPRAPRLRVGRADPAIRSADVARRPSSGLCGSRRRSRTRASRARQLPTDHGHAVLNREYQSDSSWWPLGRSDDRITKAIREPDVHDPMTWTTLRSSVRKSLWN